MANNNKNPKPRKMYDGQKFTLRNSGYFAKTTGDRCLMHRYIWENEVGKIPVGYDIHHINKDKTDNRIENFECLSKSDHTALYSPHNNQYGKGGREVKMLSLNEELIKTFSTSSAAAKSMRIDRSGINMAINGKLKTYKNYKWRYASS